MATKFITEVLKEINDNVGLLETDYKKVGNGGPLGILFTHAFTQEGKFNLPEGTPPFKESPEPQGMTPTPFISTIGKWGTFQRTDITPLRREYLFIQMLESVHPSEAKILVAVKDQNLTELYPNITREVVAKAGFIPEVKAEEVKK